MSQRSVSRQAPRPPAPAAAPPGPPAPAAAPPRPPAPAAAPAAASRSRPQISAEPRLATTIPNPAHLGAVLDKTPAVDVADVGPPALGTEQVKPAHALPKGQAHHARRLLLLRRRWDEGGGRGEVDNAARRASRAPAWHPRPDRRPVTRGGEGTRFPTPPPPPNPLPCLEQNSRHPNPPGASAHLGAEQHREPDLLAVRGALDLAVHDRRLARLCTGCGEGGGALERVAAGRPARALQIASPGGDPFLPPSQRAPARVTPGCPHLHERIWVPRCTP